ncbi:DDE_Tnp_1_7 domain-containing protein [Trichonephila clavata]|uniref:DDE_Tnp_1_7 domain-containing protein n=1 Tax=Trichonephila clavata TaxID=2740835 RepID=A0A8X6GWN3_TRICU|nr:DDE_Tnp_1_7 domain-containing protein [Trichonephila clavata]
MSSVIHSDNKSTYQERRKLDKLAAVQDIWEKWIETLAKLYNLNENITVDEQLVGFRDQCSFKQYIPSKPSKYGIKICTLCDSKTLYVLKTQIYPGKEQRSKPEKNQRIRVACDLTYEYLGHNITCDNFFTSYNLGQLLLKRK